ncbi:DNA (cytosine-5)-methyltransferase 3A, partial [Halocaridina rubra]
MDYDDDVSILLHRHRNHSSTPYSWKRNSSHERYSEEIDIVEEVIHDVVPGRRKCPIHSGVQHYRHLKMGLNSGKIMNTEEPKRIDYHHHHDLEKGPEFISVSDLVNDIPSCTSPTRGKNRPLSPCEDPLLIEEKDASNHTETNVEPLTTENFSVAKVKPSTGSKKRSFAAMRTSEGQTCVTNTQYNSSHNMGVSSFPNKKKKDLLKKVNDLQTCENSHNEQDSEEYGDKVMAVDTGRECFQNGELEPKKPDGEISKRADNSDIISSADYGRLVWGKSGSSRPWPAIVINHTDCGERKPAKGKVWVLWYGDYRITEIASPRISDFITNFKTHYADSYHEKYRLAVWECLKECRERSDLPALSSRSEYVKWGENNMPGVKNIIPNKGSYCSAKIQHHLRLIRKMYLRNMSSSSEWSSLQMSSSLGSDEYTGDGELLKPKASLLNEVRKGTRDIETLCIACDRVDCQVAAPHPYFLGGTCDYCKTELEDIACDSDLMYCTICGSPGELLVCDNSNCERVFCTGCIELLISPKALKQIVEADPWLCFLCDPKNKMNRGLLKPRPDWKEKVAAKDTKSSYEVPQVEDLTPDMSTFPNRPLRVLSLFDGIATGLYVLDKLGLDVEVYYASEINENANNVGLLNFSNRITHIGDVLTLSKKKLENMCPIDLLIGGSPCNELSYVNPLRKGLYDTSGTGCLFFFFYKALTLLQVLNRAKGVHLFWLFENVNHMPREFKSDIS